ncbi:MAG: twin-arginine translocase TatA/TatE family subunit [Myxococcota bacterium]
MGFQEILIIAGIGVLIFGAGRLPQLGQAMGKSIRNFKSSLSGDDEIDVTPKERVGPGDAADEERPREAQ